MPPDGCLTPGEHMTDLFDLSAKVAVVTGGTRGIGLMLARGLLRAGARVFVASRNVDACSAAERELAADGPVTAFPVDLATESGCTALAERIGAVLPAVHILVNNAGATWGAPLMEFP